LVRFEIDKQLFEELVAHLRCFSSASMY
jgi:hypothetical protein